MDDHTLLYIDTALLILVILWTVIPWRPWSR
jgi:hypothetical protein